MNTKHVEGGKPDAALPTTLTNFSLPLAMDFILNFEV